MLTATPAINVTAPAPLAGRIEANISVGSIIGHVVIWAVIIIVTLGLGVFFYPYAFAKFLINQCTVVDSYGHRSRLQCELNIASQLGHIIIWGLLSLVTFGIAFLFYTFKVFNYALNSTKIVP